jgi:predicted dehydrogenase
MIDAAIVGVGRWGRVLVDSVAGKSQTLRFTVGVSREPARHREFAEAHGMKMVPSLAAALADPSLAAVVLATPHSQHAQEIIAAANAGKAVYCEKPLALTKAEAARAIAACAKAGVVLAVGHDKRFFPAMQELFRIVKGGELDPILHLEGHFSNELTAQLASPWRYTREEAPAGGFTQTGIHVLDAFIHLGGPVKRVAAQVLSHRPPPDALDSLSVMLEFSCGLSGLLAAVRSTPMHWRVRVFGRGGWVEALGHNDIVLCKSGQGPECMSLTPADSVRANLEAFADAVSGGAPYPVPPKEMLDTVAAFEAIVKAVESRRYEAVP